MVKAIMNYFKALTQNFPPRNEENHDKPYLSKQVVQLRVPEHDRESYIWVNLLGFNNKYVIYLSWCTAPLL
jgi:hypothetical protein